MSKCILMVADDEKLAQKAVACLEPEGYQVTFAREDEVSEDCLRSADLVLYHDTVEEPGYRVFIKNLYEEFGEQRPRVIVLSTRTGYRGGLHASYTAPDMFIADPFIPAELASFVRRLMGQ